MAILKTILNAALGAVVQGLVSAFNEWRQRKNLRELGRTKAQLKQTTEARDALRRALETPSATRSGVSDKLRNGNF